MKTSIPTRLGYGVGAAAVLASVVVGIASTASADVNNVSTVPSSEGNPSAALVEYDLAQSDPRQADACEEGDFRFVDVTLTVSATGGYVLSDIRSEANIPDEFSPATTQRDVADGYYSVLGPEGSCVVETSGEDNFLGLRTAQLEANVTYTLRLSHFDVENLPGVFGVLLSGPGTVTVEAVAPEPEGVSFEEAQAACVPGAPAPEGYNDPIDGRA